MAWPENSQVNSDIIHDDFYSSLELAATQRFYGRLAAEKTQEEITATYASLGSVPEPRQLQGTLGGGPRQAVLLKDWILTASVNEWESTVYLRRLIAISKAGEAREKASQMGFKAQKFMDKTFCVALTASTNGYDGVPVYSSAHPESGAN